jgi:hypothetical protein
MIHLIKEEPSHETECGINVNCLPKNDKWTGVETKLTCNKCQRQLDNKPRAKSLKELLNEMPDEA